MVTVVSTVPHPSVVKEAVCRNYSATLNYVPSDIQKRIESDYGRCVSLHRVSTLWQSTNSERILK
jgi:hypothetical protein